MRFLGLTRKLHPRLSRDSVALAGVAPSARAYQIVPRVLAPMGTGNNVVERHGHVTHTAVLTGIIIAPHEIGLGQRNGAPPDLDEVGKTQNGRNGKRVVHAVHSQPVGALDYLGLAQKAKHHCTPSPADA